MVDGPLSPYVDEQNRLKCSLCGEVIPDMCQAHYLDGPACTPCIAEIQTDERGLGQRENSQPRGDLEAKPMELWNRDTLLSYIWDTGDPGDYAYRLLRVKDAIDDTARLWDHCLGLV